MGRGKGCFVANPLAAVRRQDLGGEMHLVLLHRRQCCDRRMARPAERSGERPLGLHRRAARRVVEQFQQLHAFLILGPALDAEGALAGGGKHDVERDRRADVVEPEAMKPRCRQDRRVDLARVQLLQPGVDIAA
jgi:hypothetical protein